MSEGAGRRMEILESPLLAEFRHGFTTRGGGASPPPFDALNLGGAVGDDPSRVAENWRRVERETGLRFARVRQVHGATAVRARGACEPGEEADAVLCAEAGIAACVSVADCVPILLADPESGAVAAVHAGWRGTLAAVAAEAVEALRREFGAEPSRLVGAVGPSIGACCYEVSAELAARFEGEIGVPIVREGGRPPRLDLAASNGWILSRAGVPRERIHVLGACTSCDPVRFFSHRRDRGRTGRQIAFIAARAPTRRAGVP
jgi:YfiH family protein